MSNKKLRFSFWKVFALSLATVVFLQFVIPAVLPDSSPVITAQAHSGRTDSSGGHKDNKNKSGLGNYHYHCGGHPPHLHKSGVCPYDSSNIDTVSPQTDSSQPAASSSSGKSATSSSALTKSEIKKVQQKLNDLGYDCGTPDGVLGKKTKKALEAFQKDNGIKESGIIDEDTKEKLEL